MQILRMGRVFVPNGHLPWMSSHAAYPTPLLLKDRIRVFFCTRDKENRGSVAWIDVSASNPTEILNVSAGPSLNPGPLGAFDDRGISIGSILATDRGLLLYYLGWNKSADVPFRNSIGVAISPDGEGVKFSRLFEGPLLDRSRCDPFTLSYPFVEQQCDGRWLMHYGTSRSGGFREQDMRHVITTAISEDGIDWTPSGQDLIAPAVDEYGLARPWLFSSKNRRYMLFSVRTAVYSIGLARWDPMASAWQRIKTQIFEGDGEEWESGESCYASTIEIKDRIYMFYCGKRYGLTGFGVAEIVNL